MSASLPFCVRFARRRALLESRIAFPVHSPISLVRRLHVKDVHPDSDHGRRLTQLDEYVSHEHRYPRVTTSKNETARWSLWNLKRKASALAPNERSGKMPVIISGRITAIRWAGPMLAFVDITDGGVTAQVVCNLGPMLANGVPQRYIDRFKHVARRGDWYSVSGHPHKTKKGEPGLLATSLPRLDAPSLHQIPTAIQDAETNARKPHLNMLTDPDICSVLKARSRIEHELNKYFIQNGFQKVTTPILSGGAGGAIARPFETVATELRDNKLNLRIAPELWLKRLVIGGLGRVYEIGPVFRNEGIDATHNPEYTTCEFYMPYADLETLMTMTQDMLCKLWTGLRDHTYGFDNGQIYPLTNEFASVDTLRFPRLRFIPTLEREMQCALPDLDSDNAAAELIECIAKVKGLKQPANSTLPRLLDALSGHFIEPLCTTPTFITEHPAALSPLAKSFRCQETGQRVAARAELFIAGREYANMYEEENSPVEQRKKFLQQLQYRSVDGEGDGRAEVDESYLEALEYGLPPTGGWGLGFDRLVMLFTGQSRIGDVLPFGTLRNVVGLAAKQRYT